MKVLGTVNNHSVRIFLDSGSTHNFIDSRLIKTLGWSLQATKPFEVMIADGEKSKAKGVVGTYPWKWEDINVTLIYLHFHLGVVTWH